MSEAFEEPIPAAASETAIAVPEASVLEYEAPQLSKSDIDWLQSLSGKVVDRQWLDEANLLVEVGSRHLPSGGARSDAPEVAARYKFLGELLGWDDPQHKLHKSYQTFKGLKPALGPLSTTIATQRLLHSWGISNDAVTANNPSILWKRHTTVAHTLNGLTKLGYDAASMVEMEPTVTNADPARVGLAHQLIAEAGEDPVAAGTSNPLILVRGLRYTEDYLEGNLDSMGQIGSDAAQWLADYCLNELSMTHQQFQSGVKQLRGGPSVARLEATIAVFAEHSLDTKALLKANLRLLNFSGPRLVRKIEAVERVCQLLGWEGEAKDLINSDQRVLASSDAKLLVHARLFARFGRPSMSKSEVAKLIGLPLESHIIALALGKQYKASKIAAVNAAFPERATRISLVEQLFQDREALKIQLGRGTVRAYERYAQRPRHA